ncbi:hypothetical protein J6590_034414 [Homalodisca vitripennis]|nr:hypothetical protein J6590_034414 [Homalodisca vitripennis]
MELFSPFCSFWRVIRSVRGKRSRLWDLHQTECRHLPVLDADQHFSPRTPLGGPDSRHNPPPGNNTADIVLNPSVTTTDTEMYLEPQQANYCREELTSIMAGSKHGPSMKRIMQAIHRTQFRLRKCFRTEVPGYCSNRTIAGGDVCSPNVADACYNTAGLSQRSVLGPIRFPRFLPI